ncbi:MAG: DegV family protein [Chloroflexi bacterium]|nr:DegV family protein [Chloroflexota bacterium]
MVIVVTDSCASIPPLMIAELGIEVVPYHVHSTLGTLRDGVDMPPDEFYGWLKDTRDWPTTANPSAGDYLEAYRRAAKRGEGVVAVSMTGAGSGGYQSAVLASRLAEQELPGVPIEVLDTRQVGLAHGWAVIQAARAALHGRDVPGVLDVARNVAERAFVGFTNDTLVYLQRGGRIGRMQGMMGNVLNIKPLIGMKAGMPSLLAVARSRRHAYRRIVALAQEVVPAGSTVRVALMHVSAPEEVQQFRPLLEDAYAVIEWVEAQLSPALGVHSGPGTVGIALIADKP